MPKIRYVSETIDKMMPHIPFEEQQLLKDLAYLRDSIFLELPEGNPFAWVKLQYIMGEYLPQPTHDDDMESYVVSLDDWQAKMFLIFRGED